MSSPCTADKGAVEEASRRRPPFVLHNSGNDKISMIVDKIMAGVSSYMVVLNVVMGLEVGITRHLIGSERE